MRDASGHHNHPIYSLVNFELTTPDGKTHRLDRFSDAMTRYDLPPTHTVKPGRAVVDMIELDLWELSGNSKRVSAKTLLTEPGEYKLRCLLPADREKRFAEFRAIYGPD